MTFPSLPRISPVRALAHAIGIGLLGVFLGCAQNAPGTKGGVSGSSGSSTSIRLDKTSITLQGVSNSGNLASANLTVTYTGTTPVVGYPAGTPAVTWIGIHPITLGSGVDTYSVSASTDVLTPGTYTTTLRFATALPDGSSPVYVDLPITYTLTATIVAGEAVQVTQVGMGEPVRVKPSPADAALAQATGIEHILSTRAAE